MPDQPELWVVIQQTSAYTLVNSADFRTEFHRTPLPPPSPTPPQRNIARGGKTRMFSIIANMLRSSSVKNLLGKLTGDEKNCESLIVHRKLRFTQNCIHVVQHGTRSVVKHRSSARVRAIKKKLPLATEVFSAAFLRIYRREGINSCAKTFRNIDRRFMRARSRRHRAET